jgi:hypothetical protein
VLATAFCRRELWHFNARRHDGLRAVKKSSSPQNAETSTLQACAPRSFAGRVAGFLLVLCTTVFVAVAQESPTSQPSPSVSPKPIRISFLPPPLEGTISLGIYDAKGKLVRMLHREADIEDFEIGSDALTTTWDGKNDAGENSPAGKYRARGYVVGELVVEGVGFFFNDWMRDDQSPHIAKITGIAVENGVPLLTAQLSGEETATLICDEKGNVMTTGGPMADRPDCHFSDWPQLMDPVACAAGKAGTQWVIDRVSKGSSETEVKQFSTGKELLRRLSVPAQDPQPRAIAALKDADTIFLDLPTPPCRCPPDDCDCAGKL